MQNFDFIDLEIKNKIAFISLNRPDKANALNHELWLEISNVFKTIDQEPNVRVAIMKGNGKHFCAGIDLNTLGGLTNELPSEPGRRSEKLREIILKFQSCFNAIEECRKPVLAAIHGSCIGGAVDMISACDIRYATHDAKFCIKEIDIGMVADVGTMQRLPKIIPDGVMRELAYTGRTISGAEAEKIGLINRSFESETELFQYCQETAQVIAQKSPLAIRGTKQILLYSRDHSVQDSLNYVATWNSTMLLSEDLPKSVEAQMTQKIPEFKD